jgi:type IV secretory pathway VirB10-like protein
MKKVIKNNKPSNTPVDKVKTREYTDSAEYSQAKKSYGDSLSLHNKWDTKIPNSKTRLTTKKEKKEWKDEKTGIAPTTVQYKGTFEYFGNFPKPVETPIYRPVKKEQVKPVPQKTEAKKPSGETKLKQGREFMKETGLRPGYYSDSQVQEAISKKIPIKRR